MIDQQLREAVAAHLAAKKLTQAQFAAQAGVPTASLCVFLKGSGVGVGTAAKMAQALGLELRKARKK